MSYLFDYGEFLICCAPMFLMIAVVGLLLLANSRPSNKPNDGIAADDKPGEQDSEQ